MADGDLHLSESPNVDTGLVEKDGSLHRTILTAEPEGTLQLSDSANVSTGYVTDDQGKKHKVNLVAEVEGDLELPENPNADTGYVTDGDGKKHKVKLTASLHGGGTPINNQDISVTINGTYTADEGYTGLGTVSVDVPTSAPEIYRVFRSNNGVLTNSISTAFIQLPSSVTDIGDYCLYSCYSMTPASVLSGAIDLSSLTAISGAYGCYSMFVSCPGITSADLSSLTTISGSYSCSSMFSYSGLTSLDLSSLTTISGQNSCQSMCINCTSLTNVDLGSLTTVSGSRACSQMFANTALTSVVFSSLTTLSGSYACSSMFISCINLTSLSFPALTSSSFGTQTNQFQNLIIGVTGCTIHFPSNLDPAGGSTVISSLSGYPDFGGTNTVLAFDLPATN